MNRNSDPKKILVVVITSFSPELMTGVFGEKIMVYDFAFRIAIILVKLKGSQQIPKRANANRLQISQQNNKLP